MLNETEEAIGFVVIILSLVAFQLGVWGAAPAFLATLKELKKLMQFKRIPNDGPRLTMFVNSGGKIAF